MWQKLNLVLVIRSSDVNIVPTPKGDELASYLRSTFTQRSIPKFKTSPILILFTLISTYGVASEKRWETGFVQKISESRIELDVKHTGAYSHIGFLCEPEICKTTNTIKIGDEVLLSLGSVDNKNKLLSITKCLINDPECNEVKKVNIQEATERKKRSEISFENHQRCRAKMNKDLADQNKHFPDSEAQSGEFDKIQKKYNNMHKQTERKKCLNSFVKSYYDALLETCIKHGCGQNIGGGCYHIAGHSITASLLEAAIEQCSI